MIRNAGGRASDDAIRSLVISYKLLGTREWFVIHHTDCGMELFTDEIMRNLLADSLKTATLEGGVWRDTGPGPGSTEGHYIDWLTIREPSASVIADVGASGTIRWCPTTFPSTGISTRSPRDGWWRFPKPPRQGKHAKPLGSPPKRTPLVWTRGWGSRIYRGRTAHRRCSTKRQLFSIDQGRGG